MWTIKLIWLRATCSWIDFRMEQIIISGLDVMCTRIKNCMFINAPTIPEIIRVWGNEFKSENYINQYAYVNIIIIYLSLYYIYNNIN